MPALNTATAASPLRPRSETAGYTHAARDETSEAAASAKITLEIINRHPAVLHLPLTYTVAEASRRLLFGRAGGYSHGSFPESYVDPLVAARESLVFARPAQASEDGSWCDFGDSILAAFEKVAVCNNGDVSPKVRWARGVCLLCCMHCACFILYFCVVYHFGS